MSPSHPGRGGRPLYVTIVSANAETLDGLAAYLRRAGVTTLASEHVEKLLEMTPLASSVVLLFPDDFGWESVMSALAALRAERPKTLPVLITKEPQRFESLLSTGGGVVPLLVPKPVWGWTILDAIRARIDAEPGETRKLL